MSWIILHHFDASPFSEKIRALLGYKAIQWQSVLIPRIMPKPELVALTGGYRKTPVLQVGRDLYFDTCLIARIVESLQPEPATSPAAQAASIAALEHMADRRFFLAAIPVLFRPAGRTALVDKLGEDYLAKFKADRDRLFSGGTVGRPDEAFSQAVWQPTLAALDRQLAAQDFLLGERPTLADFAVYHPIWYVRGNPGVADTLGAHRNLLAWADRIAAFGHGERVEIDAPRARVEAAHCDHWQPLPAMATHDIPAIEPGARVDVAATDYGTETVSGRLVRMGAETMVIERDGPDGSPLRLHMPRDGFRIDPAPA